MAALAGVVGQLFANLAVDFIPEEEGETITLMSPEMTCLSDHIKPAVKQDRGVDQTKSEVKQDGTQTDLMSGLKMPCPMIKWSFSRLDVGRSSSSALPLPVYSPSFSLLATSSVILDFFFRVKDTSFLRMLRLACLVVGSGSFSCRKITQDMT